MIEAFVKTDGSEEQFRKAVGVLVDAGYSSDVDYDIMKYAEHGIDFIYVKNVDKQIHGWMFEYAEKEYDLSKAEEYFIVQEVFVTLKSTTDVEERKQVIKFLEEKYGAVNYLTPESLPNCQCIGVNADNCITWMPEYDVDDVNGKEYLESSGFVEIEMPKQSRIYGEDFEVYTDEVDACGVLKHLRSRGYEDNDITIQNKLDETIVKVGNPKQAFNVELKLIPTERKIEPIVINGVSYDKNRVLEAIKGLEV